MRRLSKPVREVPNMDNKAVTKFIVGHFSIEGDPSVVKLSDQNIDSLDFLEFIMELEYTFEVDIEDEIAAQLPEHYSIVETAQYFIDKAIKV